MRGWVVVVVCVLWCLAHSTLAQTTPVPTWTLPPTQTPVPTWTLPPTPTAPPNETNYETWYFTITDPHVTGIQPIVNGQITSGFSMQVLRPDAIIPYKYSLNYPTQGGVLQLRTVNEAGAPSAPSNLITLPTTTPSLTPTIGPTPAPPTLH